MNILAIDTATGILSVSLSAPSGCFHFQGDGGPSHGERLMEAVDFLMAGVLEREELELVACMEGPGSFTGLRIGFAAAKGLSLALGIPLVPVPTLDCMAFPHGVWPGPVIPGIDAKKKRFFAAIYRGGRKVSDYLDAPPEEIAALLAEARSAAGPEPALITGPDAPLLLGALSPLAENLFLDPRHRQGKSAELLEISRNTTILYGKSVFAADNAGPMYLRKSDAELAESNEGKNHK